MKIKQTNVVSNLNKMHTCSQCHKGVIVLNGEVIKACSCDASIIANLSSSLIGMGGVTI